MKQSTIIRSLLALMLLLPMVSSAQTENFWTRKSDFLGLKRERAVAFTADGFAFVGTGLDTAEIVHNDFWKYDPIADSWTQVADLPGSVRRNAIAFSVADKGYVGTGMNTATSQELGATKLSDMYEYDPTTNQWTAKAPFPGAFGGGIYFATGFAIDSKGYICGGKIGSNWYSSELWEYKPSTDQWIQLPSFPGGVRYQLSSFTIGFKGYVGMGTDQDLYRKDFWAFDASTNQWTAVADLPGSERASSMTFTIGNRGYVCMGTNGGMLDDLWEYNPDNDQWSSKAPYGGSRRKGGVGFSLNGKGYLGTGKGYSGKKQSIHEYTPTSFVGLDELTAPMGVYPNPASEFINVLDKTYQIESVQICGLNGKVIQESHELQSIDIRGLETGMYLLFGRNSKNEIIASQKINVQ